MNSIIHRACLSLIICLSAPILATATLTKVQYITIPNYAGNRPGIISTMNLPQDIMHTHAHPTCETLWTKGLGRNRMVILRDNGVELIKFRRTGPNGQVDKDTGYIQLANGEEFAVNRTSSCPLVTYLFKITNDWSDLSNDQA